uniref:Oxysterol-binding protein n=1 Tax=Hydra vulgaris TaxID=6087 RepID=T2M5M8_HYDVU
MTEQEDALLLASRQGHSDIVFKILSAGGVDINCKGKQKSNLGWTPLHLASYFGHQDVVETLLKFNADVNVINGMGDTPLHRAAFTGRTDVVLSLLHYNADVSIINGEGRTPLLMTDCPEVKKLIAAAEKSQQLSRNVALLQATTDGDLQTVKSLLSSTNPPNINCQNLLGNTALHCASFRGHKEIAVFLLQNGIDSTIKNNRGLSALELSRDPKMRQLLDIHPLQTVQKTVERFEGYIMKKSRFFGWKKHWVILERGILSAFHTRADAASGLRRQFFKYLDHAKILANQEFDQKFKIQFSDHTVYFFMTNLGQVDCQRWLNALNEHCAYSTHYTSQPHIILTDELDEDYMPLGCIDDALKNAKAQQQVLGQQVSSLALYFNSLSDQQIRQGTATTLRMKLSEIVSSSQEVSSTLKHCLTILMQQEEVRRVQLQEEAEKRRVLEDALHVLATEHFVLEQSVRHKMNSHDDAMDVFYDATEAMSDCEYGGPFFKEDSSNGDSNSGIQQLDEREVCENIKEECRPVNGELQMSDSMTHSNTISKYLALVLKKLDDICKPSLEVRAQVARLVCLCLNHRRQLPHTMHSRNEFSIWSVLKQAVGKDLSKMTMPVIFNEPISFLQRIAEYMDYGFIMQKAANLPDPIDRIEVAVFVMSCNASTEDRVGKPFNPLLGETYELIREDMDFRLIAEQVSHHPPISAIYAECPKSGIEMTMSMQPDIKFWGKSVEVKPKGHVIIKIPKYNDVYTFSYVSSGIHNVIIGNLWIEMYGVCEITNQNTGDRAILNFKPAGWFGKDLNKVDGYVVDKKGVKKKLIKGNWAKFACSCPADDENAALALNAWCTSRTINDFTPPAGVTLHWKVKSKPKCSAEMYNMTEFAMGLNELLPEHENVIAPTDSRYRLDMRCLENGDIEGAAAEKQKLEEAQRERRKLMHSSGEIWIPMWFSLEENEYLKCKEWSYNHKYFKRNYRDCVQIY